MNEYDEYENLCPNNDFVNYISGFYCLLDLHNDTIDHISVSKEGLKNLCNDFVSDSFQSVSEIDYKQLNSQSLHLIGCYGNHDLIAKLLLNHEKIDQPLYEMLIRPSSLRPGIYFLVFNSKLGLVIHWSEYGCYENRAPLRIVKNMINLHRDRDLNRFDWKKEVSSIDNDDDSCYEFEVKKSQKQEFAFFNGYNISLPEAIESEIKNQSYNEISLKPKVVESISCQAFVTQMIITPYDMKKNSATRRKSTFGDFMNKLGDHSIRINRSTMDMNKLKILIDYGLNIYNLKEQLVQYDDEMNYELKEFVKREKQEVLAIQNGAYDLERIARKRLKELYRCFDDNKSDEVDEPEISKDIEGLFLKYPNLTVKLDAASKINTDEWMQLKRGFSYGTLLIKEVQAQASKTEELDNKELDESIWQAFYKVLNVSHPKPLTFNHIYKDYFKNLRTKLHMKHKFTFKLDDIQINEYYNQAMSIDLSDSTIIDLLLDNEFCPNNSKLRESIIKLFRDIYDEWKTNKFSDNINKLYWSKLIEVEHKRHKQDILRNTFEKLCELIEERFPDGPLFNVLNISLTEQFFIVSKVTIDYEVVIMQPAQLQITIYETILEQDDCLKFDHPEHPKYLSIIWNNKTNRMELRVDTIQGSIIDNTKKYQNMMNASKFCLIAVNESKGLIGIYNTDNGMLNVFHYDEQINLHTRNINIRIFGWYNNSIPDIGHFLFIENTEELCFVEKSGRARIYNLVNGQFRTDVSQFPPESTKILSTPDGTCIVAFVKEQQQSLLPEIDSSEISLGKKDDDGDTQKSFESFKDLVKVYVYFISDFGKPTNKVIEMPSNMQFVEYFKFYMSENRQTYLTTLDIIVGVSKALIVKIVDDKKAKYQLQQCHLEKSTGQVKFESAAYSDDHLDKSSILIGRQTNFTQDIEEGENIIIMDNGYEVIEIISDSRIKIADNVSSLFGVESWLDFRIEPKTKLNGFIDSYKLMFEKYPIDNCIDNEQNRPFCLHIVLDILSHGDNAVDIFRKYRTNFEEYVLDMFKDLKRETNKPQLVLKEFLTCVSTFQEFNVDNLIRSKKNKMKNYQLGEWIIQLLCLIPIQIAVSKNHQFQPLCDGSLKAESEQSDGYHIMDNITRNISFGWYEGILNHFGDRKVKVVSSMGEHSCGKSYFLNHLIGTSFDGSEMREGVWMSLVNTQKCIYVVLNFEGLVSLEKSSQDDLLLALFGTVMSNLIFFKCHFAINRDMSLMFQRFQDGAMLFESDPKLFQAKLCVIIKDVPRTEKEIVREFQSKVSRLISNEGENNFISRMFQGELNVIPWPMFNDAAWFNALSDVNKKLDEQEANICEWSSLDNSLIQIRIAMLMRLLPTAVSYGMEQHGVIARQLMNHDTGESIDDPIVDFSKILDDIDESVEVLPDSDVKLYDEHESFVRLSEDLKRYFEENIQSRKDLSGDKWFTNFDIFFRYIIERRVSRIQDWFTQNTAKFPQINIEIVNGIYAMEQEISKLTILWTLCGLTCHQCDLKCVKNLDHNEQHDCLTDHKCHSYCQFVEAHNNKLVPRCMYKAEHEGFHVYDKVKHACSKPCDLSDKGNCQLVCSKEMGHGDIHLCQSSRHYCGKACSLQKEVYHCRNKCIIPHDEQHTYHRCENELCPIQCPIPNCRKKCQSNDHFHSDLHVDHFCGNEHQCRELCEESGVCKITTEPKEKSRVEFTKYVQLGERLRCNRKIPPNKFKHDGGHIHEEGGFHFCDAKHGNMSQIAEIELIGEDNEPEYEGLKLRVGDHRTFYLCNLCCKNIGKHHHIDHGQNEDNRP
ncbi:12160_t:CDS:10, partial [Funneliformis caledonium]